MSQVNRVRDPDQPIVTEANFYPGGEGRVHVHVVGRNFVERGIPVEARVGAQVVGRLVLRGDGRGFAGTLERGPREGDRLYVGYADSELQPTDVVVRGGGSGAMLARREDADAEGDENENAEDDEDAEGGTHTNETQ